MISFLSEQVACLDAYVPGEQPKDKKYIKLNTNECPFPPAPRVLEEIKKAANDDLRLYPDPEATQLIEELAKIHDLESKNVFVGNGSDEILAFAFGAFYWHKAVQFPALTYSFYPVYAQLYQCNVQTTPMLDQKVDVDAYMDCGKGIILANPNAPTGEWIDEKIIEEMVKSNPEQLVLIDEAYIDFGGRSVCGLVKKYPNILVVQTFSKSRALAGMRIGMAFGHEDLIKGLNRIKNTFNSYTVDRLSQVAGVAALKEKDYYEKIQKKIIQIREQVSQDLMDLGFQFIQSMGNFLFVKHPQHGGDQLYKQLREKGLLVRYFDKPMLRDYLRITIGTQEQMDELIKTIKEII